MSRVIRATRSSLRRHVLKSTTYQGTDGTAWFAGSEPRAPSIAAYFCGDDVQAGSSGLVRHGRIPRRIEDIAGDGGLAVLRLPDPDKEFTDILRRAISVPSLVDIHTELPPDLDGLRTQLLTSTTKEDFRRIRKANFTYRVTTDPEAVREFHTNHYVPLVKDRYPDDGRIWSLEQMLAALERGGELVCADIDGEWVAGIFNMAHETDYALLSLGIRDADDAVRQKRVIAALIVQSLERAVEIGRDRATLGRSLPFLGKGPVWFKAKWGGIVSSDPHTSCMQMFMDLRHVAVRRMLASSPVIHSEGGALVATKWLDPGEKPLQVTTREAGRFPGVTRWYVFGEAETLAAGDAELSERERIVQIPLDPSSSFPLWLGDLLPRPSGVT